MRFASKTAPASNVPFYLAHFRKVPALAISGALLVCLGIVLFSWLIAQKSTEGLEKQSASGLLVVTLSPGSSRTSGTTLLTHPRRVDVKLELELADYSFHESQSFQVSEALDTRDALTMEAKG